MLVTQRRMGNREVYKCIPKQNGQRLMGDREYDRNIRFPGEGGEGQPEPKEPYKSY